MFGQAKYECGSPPVSLAYLLAGILCMLGKMHGNDARFLPGVGAGSKNVSLAAKRRRLGMQRTDAESGMQKTHA